MNQIYTSWTWHRGIGHLPLSVAQVPYDQAYFDKYVNYEKTKLGKDISKIRAEHVTQRLPLRLYNKKLVVDVGIGSGAFIKEMLSRGYQIQGHDVNPAGVKWLQRNKLRWDGKTQADVVTFWDVLEHIEDPAPLLTVLDPTYICLCMPIYMDERHALRSKHFRPGEHCWYFTSSGLIEFMERYHFECVYMGAPEITVGREDIFSFTFKSTRK